MSSILSKVKAVITSLSEFQIWQRNFYPRPRYSTICRIRRISIRRLWPWTLTLTFGHQFKIYYFCDTENLCQIQEYRSSCTFSVITTTVMNIVTNQRRSNELAWSPHLLCGGNSKTYDVNSVPPRQWQSPQQIVKLWSVRVSCSARQWRQNTDYVKDALMCVVFRNAL